jgi:hypothetical protein
VTGNTSPILNGVAMIHRFMACGLGVMLAACATVPNPTAQTPPAVASSTYDIGAIFDTRTAKYFGDATVPLRGFLAASWLNPPPAGPQHFCIVGYDPGPDDNGVDGRMAYVHWKEGNRLIGWTGIGDPEYAADSIRFSPDNLDLTKDVVATDSEINSSTYLVTQAWVDGVLADCAARGAEYTV